MAARRAASKMLLMEIPDLLELSGRSSLTIKCIKFFGREFSMPSCPVQTVRGWFPSNLLDAYLINRVVTRSLLLLSPILSNTGITCKMFRSIGTWNAVYKNKVVIISSPSLFQASRSTCIQFKRDRLSDSKEWYMSIMPLQLYKGSCGKRG